MRTRKERKAAAKKVLRKHYWLFVVLCILAGMLGTEFTSSVNATANRVEMRIGVSAGSGVSGASEMSGRFSEILVRIASGQEEEGRMIADEAEREAIERSMAEGESAFGRSRGVFSSLVNKFASGSLLVSLAVGIHSIVGSDSMTAAVLIAGVIGILLAFWIFVINLYQVIMRRMFLEGRCYEKVHLTRALFLLKVRRWMKAGITMLAASAFETLWWLTIVGGIIKHYSYYLVPYIVAENPDISAKEALSLSSSMMKGFKWQCFLFELSFWGWKIPGVLSFGLVDVFFTNPYKTAAFAEYYADLRRLAKQNRLRYAERLNDWYLFRKPDEEVLRAAYPEILEEIWTSEEKLPELTGIRKVLADVFGLMVWNRQDEKEYERIRGRQIRLEEVRDAIDGKAYPLRLNPIPEKQKRNWISGLNYIRYYSVWSVIMMFFVLSFAGWLWEVGLHLLTDGTLVNRGVLHGPWLPIYGSGTVLILLLLKRFREKPAAEFLMIMLLCGVVEYFTSYYLEITHNGKKWWDYSGYFLNLDGRICAEGILTFGVGGMMIVYLLAPVLDNLFKKIPFRALTLSGLILVSVFTADLAYSRKRPNEGTGITDYQSSVIRLNIQAASPAIHRGKNIG